MCTSVPLRFMNYPRNITRIKKLCTLLAMSLHDIRNNSASNYEHTLQFDMVNQKLKEDKKRIYTTCNQPNLHKTIV